MSKNGTMVCHFLCVRKKWLFIIEKLFISCTSKFNARNFTKAISFTVSKIYVDWLMSYCSKLFKIFVIAIYIHILYKFVSSIICQWRIVVNCISIFALICWRCGTGMLCISWKLDENCYFRFYFLFMSWRFTFKVYYKYTRFVGTFKAPNVKTWNFCASLRNNYSQESKISK